MKKKMLVSVILGMLAGTATAQSNVTLYGELDVGYGVGNGGIYEGSEGNDSKFQQWGNSKSTSVWGLKGNEDLGNGLNIYFNLESEISPEDGDMGDTLFGQAAYVGLSGAFGAIQIGRQSTVSSNIMGEFDVSEAPTLTSSLGNAGVSGDAQRYGEDTYDHLDSALVYISPEFSGFQLQASLVLKNDDVFGHGTQAKSLYSVGGTFTYGDLTLGAVVESKPESEASTSWGLGAKYDFGSFQVAGSYFDNHLRSDGKGFSLGVSAPIGAFEVGAQIAYNTKIPGDNVPVYETQWNWWTNSADQVQVGTHEEGKLKPLAWELFATYSLSKRTQLYAQYGGINNDAKEFNAATRKYSASIGIIHSF